MARVSLAFALLLTALGCASGSMDPITGRIFERCDGLDDDGDGEVDEGHSCHPGDSEVCGDGGLRSCTVACQWAACVGGGTCEPGETSACGQCGTRTCGADRTWGECTDEGACAAGSSRDCEGGRQLCTASCEWDVCAPTTCTEGDERACGNCGTQACTLDADGLPRWEPCSSEGECAPGESGTCGLGGSHTCTAECTWGTCEGSGSCFTGAERPCGMCGRQTCGTGDAPGPFEWATCEAEGECAAGETRECGLGGVQTCGTDCGWGECFGEGDCTPGQTRACGFCGTQTCGGDGRWSECGDAGACMPGAVDECGLGGEQTCTELCEWGTCEGEGECAPGTTETCGDCGTRFCGADYTWSACSGEGVCSPGGTESCGLGGTSTCTATCNWGACEGEGECAPGETQSCGFCGTQTCAGGSWGTCTGGGACEVGATEACGLGGTRTCDGTCGWGTCDAQEHGLGFGGGTYADSAMMLGGYDFGGGAFTLEAYVRADGTQSSSLPVLMSTRSGSDGWRFGLNFVTAFGPSGVPYVGVGAQVWVPDAGPDIRDGELHHVAVVCGSALIYYVDGVEIDREGSCPSALRNAMAARPVSLGNTVGFAYPFHGDMHDARIWTVALPASTIASHAGGTEPTLPATGLVSWWHLGEGSGQTAMDSVSGNHLTLGSAPGADADDPDWILF